MTGIVEAALERLASATTIAEVQAIASSLSASVSSIVSATPINGAAFYGGGSAARELALTEAAKASAKHDTSILQTAQGGNVGHVGHVEQPAEGQRTEKRIGVKVLCTN